MPKLIHYFGDEFFKECASCHKQVLGNFAYILKSFGRNKSRSDGFATECRECRAMQYIARKERAEVDKPDLIMV